MVGYLGNIKQENVDNFNKVFLNHKQYNLKGLYN